MKEYRISEIYVGMKEKFSQEITSEMMNEFLKLSGDKNPLHTNVEYARRQGYENCVVYGMLTAALISKLGGCYLPGKYCLIQGVDIKFTQPVFVGDVLDVIGEVKRVDIDLKYIEVKVVMVNQVKDTVLRGILKAGVMNE